MNKYSIYVISKGRWERRQTVKTLLKMGVDFLVFVEPSEYDKYKSVINEKYLKKCPEDFSKRGMGGIPVRNYVWDYSISKGEKKHWILDDNIESFERYNNNLKIPCFCPQPFTVCEDFTDRYENVKISGMNYSSFCPASDGRPPFQKNTRVYSNLLIDNSLRHRWRGKYNEDTDLCLRVLKDGYCTILFNAFLIGKRATMCQKGGNTDTIYNNGDQRLEFAESLRDQHPDLVEVVRRFDRWHHKVNYKPFKKTELIKKDGLKIIEGVNNYGMELKKP